MWKSKEAADLYQSGDNYIRDFSKIRQMAMKQPLVKYYNVDSPKWLSAISGQLSGKQLGYCFPPDS